MEATNNKIKLVKTGETIDTEKHPYSTNYVNKKAFPKMERCSCQKWSLLDILKGFQSSQRDCIRYAFAPITD